MDIHIHSETSKLERCLMFRWPARQSRASYSTRRILPAHKPTPAPIKPLRRDKNTLNDLQKAVQFAGLAETSEHYPGHWSTPSGLAANDTKIYNAALAFLQAGLLAVQSKTASPEQIWKQVFELGYSPIHGLEQTKRLDLSTMAAIFRSSHSCTAETYSPAHWPVFRTFLLDLSERKGNFATRTQGSLLDTRLTEWAWSELALRDPMADDRVKDFWHALKMKHLDHVQDLPSELFAAIVVSHSRSTTSLGSFLKDINKYARLKSRVAFQTHLMESNIPSLHNLRLDEQLWIDQAELAAFWLADQGGEEAMMRRVRRWTDRKDSARVKRMWNAIVAGSKEGKNMWIETDWIDRELDVSAVEEGERLPPESDVPEDAEQAKDLDIKFTPPLVASFLLSFLRLHHSNEAESIWSELGSRSLSPTEGLWTSLISGYASLQDPVAAADILQQVEKAGMPVSADMRAYYVRALFRSGKVTEGLQEVNHLTKQTGEVVPALVCNRLIVDLLHRDLTGTAYNLMLAMPQEGEGRILTSTVNTMLGHYAHPRTLDLKALSEALSFLAERKLEPDIITFNILISGFIAARRSDLADKMLRLMESRGMKPSERTYAPLISDLLERQLFKKADQLLKRMEELGKPNEFVYTSMIKALCEAPLADQKWNKNGLPFYLNRAHVLVARMKARSVPLGSAAYNSLILGHFKLGDEAGVEWAMKWYREMLDSAKARGKHVYPDTWYVMLDNLSEFRRYKEAKVVLEDMRAKGFEPRGSLETLVSKLQQRM